MEDHAKRTPFESAGDDFDNDFEKGYRYGKITAVLTLIPQLFGWSPDDGTPPRNERQRGFLMGWREQSGKAR